MTPKTALLLLMATAVISACGSCNASQMHAGIRDSDAKVVVSSGERTPLMLSGVLKAGYRILPNAVIIHGAPITKQRYLYLHLTRPIDVIVKRPAWKSVFHQYDIQVIQGGDDSTPEEAANSSSVINELVGKPVSISGNLATPGYDPGSPDWQPFPLTIFVESIRLHTPEPR